MCKVSFANTRKKKRRIWLPAMYRIQFKVAALSFPDDMCAEVFHSNWKNLEQRKKKGKFNLKSFPSTQIFGN